MNAEIEKLIASVKETGSMTARQKEIILEKAKELGEDPSEVEFVLESFPIRTSPGAASSKKKLIRTCPHCGAIISSLALVCTECGFDFNEEAQSIVEVNRIISEVEKKVIDLMSLSCPENHIAEIELIINSFTVPHTKFALMKCFSAAYSNYEGLENGFINNPIANAWLTKAKQIYIEVSSLPQIDEETRSWIESNKYVLAAKKKRGSTTLGLFAKIIGGFILLLLILIALIGLI